MSHCAWPYARWIGTKGKQDEKELRNKKDVAGLGGEEEGSQQVSFLSSPSSHRVLEMSLADLTAGERPLKALDLSQKTFLVLAL